MKKRFLTLFIAGLMVFSMACGKTDTSYNDLPEASDSFISIDSLGFSKNATSNEGAAYDDYDSLDLYEEDSYDSGTSMSSTSASSETGLEEYDIDRKVVYSSYIGLESKKYDDDVDKVKELVTANGGYFESSSMYGNSENANRSASFTARIPSKNYDTFMTSVGDVGSLVSKNESVDDITSNYVDVQARIKSLNTKLERLQELEANAENVTELLEIEDRINDVQYQIESYTAQKKVYDDQVDYSTINIDITEVSTYTETKADSAWNRFIEAFGDSFMGFTSFLQSFVIILIYLLPYLIIIGIILFIIFRVRKKAKSKKLDKKADKPADSSNGSK